MQFTFRPTAGERYRVLTLLSRRSWTQWALVAWLVILPVLTAGLILAQTRLTVSRVAANPWIWFVAAWCWGFLLAGRPLLRYWAARRGLTANPALAGDHIWELTADGVRVRTAANEELLRWEGGVVRAEETGEFILLFFAPLCAYYLPKRAVPAEDLPAVRAFLRAHVRGRVRVRDDESGP